MFNDSTLTAKSIKDRFNDEKNETDFSNETVVYAVRNLVNIIDQIRRERDKKAMRKRTGALSIDSSGYDLKTNITDLGDTEVGFYVYKDSITQNNKLESRDFMCEEEGYYIEGEYIYLTPAPTSTKTIYIVYGKKHTQMELTDALSSYTLPFPRQLDEACFQYLEKIFYDNQFQFDLRGDAYNEFIAEIQRVFETKTQVTII